MATINASYFQTTFTEEVASTLHLKYFWLLEEPCHWTLTHYLESLIKHDPAICNRSASVRVLHDAKIIQRHVVSGTVAETMVLAISNYPASARSKKIFQQYFKDHATTIGKAALNYETQKLRLRSAMAQQIADNEEANIRKRQHGESSSSSSKIEKKKARTGDRDVEGEEEEVESEEKCIWSEWKDFLNNPDNTAHLTQLSPEKHGVIWCGNSVRRRSCYAAELYKKTNEEVTSVEIMSIDPHLIEAINDVADATSSQDMEDAVERLNCMEVDDKLVAEKKLYSAILSIFPEEVYVNAGVEILQKTETIYRSYIFDPCLKNVAKYLRRTGQQITFLPGEIELNAITKQLQESGIKDGRYHYNADGVFHADEFSNIEILLSEVSNGYGINSNDKSSFDHYKAMFDMLAMLRTLAQKYSKGSFDTFRKLKVHFLHGHGDAIRHWSMSVQAPGVFVMNKEQRVEVPVNFFEKNASLIPFLEFYSTVAEACAETVETMGLLRDEHVSALRKNIKTPNITSVVNPIIIRLNEGKHTTIVADKCPMGIPGSANYDP